MCTVQKTYHHEKQPSATKERRRSFWQVVEDAGNNQSLEEVNGDHGQWHTGIVLQLLYLTPHAELDLRPVRQRVR